MKKLYSFDILSDKVCESKGCRKRIKQRLFEKEKDFNLCYNCWKKIEFNRRMIGTKR